MTREEQFRKNNELFALFIQEVLENPRFTKQIPKGAEILFLPENDPQLRRANLRLGEARREEGKKVIYVRIALVPQVRTVFVPHWEIAKAAA